MEERRDNLRKYIILIVVAIITVIAGYDFYVHSHTFDTFVPADSLVRITSLSEYEPSLKGTNSDSPVYIFDSGVEGGTIFYMGGTHPNESAGILSSYILMENLELEKGRVIVLPIANFSASNNTLPGYGYPPFYTIETPWGEKTYRVGSRLTNPLDQWPDPPVYHQYPSFQGLCYEDARNSNRSYPGRYNGILTERIGYAIMALLEKENVDYAFDLHEASISYPVNNTYVAPAVSEDIAFLSSMMLDAEGITIGVESSSPTNSGYSHSEWDSIAGVYPFLIEVPTPFIERITGPLTEKTIIEGRDDFLTVVSEKGYTGVPFGEDGYSLEYRVGLQLTAVKMAVDIASSFNPKKEVVASWPQFYDIIEKKVGYYIKNADESNSAVVVKTP